jgi:hypothetical protein
MFLDLEGFGQLFVPISAEFTTNCSDQAKDLRCISFHRIMLTLLSMDYLVYVYSLFEKNGTNGNNI